MFGGKMMDTFMDKLAQKMNAQEMIKANSAAEAAKMEQLQSQITEYENLLQEMRKVNLKTVENAEQVKQVVQESLQKIEEIQVAADSKEDKEELLAELKKQLEEAFNQSNDFLHKENVKVYRNVQAAMVEELNKQTETLVAKQQESSKKQKAVVPLSICIMLLIIIDIVVNLFNITIMF
ncbi:MAG: hypothetical protein J6B68_09875 [Lachnospiraceae bacterium]|jgi:ABC-type multidrug transport system fused ATPase/permease subunit|nr:hypothetical protein [Lachnospiraceae bacterium]